MVVIILVQVDLFVSIRVGQQSIYGTSAAEEASSWGVRAVHGRETCFLHHTMWRVSYGRGDFVSVIWQL